MTDYRGRCGHTRRLPPEPLTEQEACALRLREAGIIPFSDEQWAALASAREKIVSESGGTA